MRSLLFIWFSISHVGLQNCSTKISSHKSIWKTLRTKLCRPLSLFISMLTRCTLDKVIVRKKWLLRLVYELYGIGSVSACVFCVRTWPLSPSLMLFLNLNLSFNRGIIMYAVILGRMPFSTAMKDEYHRQKLLQAIQRGLSSHHDLEMQACSTGANLHKILFKILYNYF